MAKQTEQPAPAEPATTEQPTTEATATADSKTNQPGGAPKRQGRQVSFTLPAMPRISFKNIAARTKLGGLAAVLLVGLIGGYGGAYLQDHNNSGIFTTGVGNQKKVVTSESQLISSIAKNVGQSVVSVNVDLTTTSDSQSDLYRQYFGGDGDSQQQTEQAAGTGIIISKNLILTNRHVVPSGTTKVSVTLSDGTELDDVSVVGRTSESDSLDVAILKVNNADGKTLHPAAIGDSSKVAVGDDVVAIGNALGQFQNTITSGIISGYGRSITAGSSDDSSDSENLDNLFQTDAAINEGNSGGPLVNLNGQVIGLNTAVASDSQNIGFAIPINDLKGLLEHVVATGKFERPQLGVRYVSLTADIAKQYGVGVTGGAYVAPDNNGSGDPVVSGSAAEKAGIKSGDIITKVNGDDINQQHSLTGLLGQYQPGDKVTLTIVNGGNTRSVDVTLGTAPASN